MPIYKIIVVAITVMLAATGIGYRVWQADDGHKALAAAYPQVERLVAIYSLLNWRKPDQQPPHITENSDAGGSEFVLECPGVEWGKGGLVRAGQLFSCFTQKRKMNIEGEIYDVLLISTNEDWWYRFGWESLFGYELGVLVGGDGARDRDAYRLRDRIQKRTNEVCKEELQDEASRRSVCSFNIYVVRLNDLRVTGSVTFLAADGYLVRHADGSISRRKQWAIYLDDEEPITAGQINRLVQLAARSLNITETDLAKVAPELEKLWMSKDAVFLNSLFAEIDKVPDLTKLAGFLKSK